TANPSDDPEARRIPHVTAFDDALRELARGRSSSGTGGMSSKIAAAELATAAGVDTPIVDGTLPGALEAALAGHDVGTWFEATERRPARRRRIALRQDVSGAMVLNDGAVAALRHEKASLLPVGVEAVVGDFAEGNLVELRDR